MRHLLGGLAATTLLVACGPLSTSCPFVLFGGGSPTVGGQVRVPISATDPREVPAANGDVALADAQGLPLPGIHAQSAKDGSYAIPNAEPGYAYVVVARVKAPDGSEQKLRGLAEPGQAGDSADVNEATTVLTTGLTDGLTGMLGAYDDAAYNRAVALVYQHIQADGLPNLQDKAAVLAKLEAWKAADAELKKLFDGLRADLGKNQPSLDQVLAKLAARDHQPTPGPVGMPTPLATGTPAATLTDAPSAAPSASFPTGFVDGPIDLARFNGLAGMAADGNGHVYVADANNHRVRAISFADPTRPTVSTVAGTGQPGNLDGDGQHAQLNDPRDVALDGRGTLYVVENGGHRVRAIDLNAPGYAVSTFAGGAQGHEDNNGQAAKFDHPVALAYDAATQLLYVAETTGQVIRAVNTADPNHPVTTVAGHYQRDDHKNGDPLTARFFNPQGLLMGPGPALYVADTGNSVIRRIALDANGRAKEVTTVAGAYEAAAGSTSHTGNVNGPALSARFYEPIGLALDADGNLLIADTRNRLVRKLSFATGLVSTVAGPSLNNLVGQEVGLEFPAHLAADGRGGVFMTDLRLGLLFKLP
ncbi:MAG: hypothetical protein JWM80_4776 [Cyanobacteria bacterium RYN_339]|nr:hypothetical protein [Cyanobacteria bacterium RYN_339]